MEHTDGGPARDPDITPDTKDWTWVLTAVCPECGFDGRAVDPRQAPGEIRRMAGALAAVLDRDDVAVRRAPDRWSDLEYVCHVRDVCRVYDRRLELMVTEDDPLYPNWDQDATAVEDAYAAQDPAVVRTELLDAADDLARRYEALAERDWDRPGRRDDGARFTVESMTRYLLHDPHHHLVDVGVS